MTTALNRPRQRFRFRSSTWIAAAIGLLVLALIVVFAGARSYPGGSTYGTKPGDYSQWYAFMQQQGHPIQRWQKSSSQLQGKSKTFLQVADSDPSMRAMLQSQDLLDWVARGNTLVQIGWSGTVTGAPFASSLDSDQGLVYIETSRRHQLSATENDGEKAELKDKFGSAVWSHSLGKGTVIVSTYPWIAANVHAQQDGNFQFLEALIVRRGGPILIDEWIHGHRDLEPSALTPSKEQSVLGYFSRRSVVIVAGQGVVLLLLLLWGRNQRFGALLSVKPKDRNSSEQYIQALADTLEANGHPNYVLSMLGQRFRQRLRVQLGLSERRSEKAADAEIAQQWSQRTGRSSQELLELLEQTHRKHLSKRALVSWAQASEAILQDLSTRTSSLSGTALKT